MDKGASCEFEYTCEEKRWHRYFFYFTYGTVMAIIIALLIEIPFAIYLEAVIISLLVAPIVEEFVKSLFIIPIQNKKMIYAYGLLAGTGFGVGEWMLHSIFEGAYLVGTPMLAILGHAIFGFAVAIFYGAKQTKSYYLMGLMIAMILHALWNAVVIFWM